MDLTRSEATAANVAAALRNYSIEPRLGMSIPLWLGFLRRIYFVLRRVSLSLLENLLDISKKNFLNSSFFIIIIIYFYFFLFCSYSNIGLIFFSSDYRTVSGVNGPLVILDNVK